jgi:hypothetical protein
MEPFELQLLDHAQLHPRAAESSNQSIPDSNVLVSINKEGTQFNIYLNRFILEEAKQEGRKRKLEEQQHEALARDNNFIALTKFTGIAPFSGSLAKHNNYER